ncbi:MAG: hypothetical protein JO069_04505 [Verrucomicrobia bacterium]|nr:hypothetical protein [Verrucomicrobiota bacterium]
MQELIEIVYRCNPEAGVVGRITWDAGRTSTALDSWQGWLRTCFRPILLPHLVLVHQEARVQGVRELCRAAHALDAQLPAVPRQRSLAAGERLIFQKPPQGDRVQGRFLAEVRSSRAPGHFATLFALRGAGFSLPLRTSLLAYLVQELFGGDCSPDALARLLGQALPAVNDGLKAKDVYAEGGAPLHG